MADKETYIAPAQFTPRVGKLREVFYCYGKHGVCECDESGVQRTPCRECVWRDGSGGKCIETWTLPAVAAADIKDKFLEVTGHADI